MLAVRSGVVQLPSGPLIGWAWASLHTVWSIVIMCIWLSSVWTSGEHGKRSCLRLQIPVKVNACAIVHGQVQLSFKL